MADARDEQQDRGQQDRRHRQERDLALILRYRLIESRQVCAGPLRQRTAARQAERSLRPQLFCSTSRSSAEIATPTSRLRRRRAASASARRTRAARDLGDIRIDGSPRCRMPCCCTPPTALSLPPACSHHRGAAPSVFGLRGNESLPHERRYLDAARGSTPVNDASSPNRHGGHLCVPSFVGLGFAKPGRRSYMS